MGKGTGTDTLGNQLQGKEYKDAINDLVKTTCIRPSDFDPKAFILLDTLQKHGRLGDACAHLKKSLEGTSRDRVGNWRGYIYTLLRGFDEAAYNEVKASRTDRRRRRGEKSKDDGDEVEEDVAKPSPTHGSVRSSVVGKGNDIKPPVIDVVLADAVPTTTLGRSTDRSFNAGACAFVPGQKWTPNTAPDRSFGSAVNPVGGTRKDLKPSATEFRPGQMSRACGPSTLAPSASKVLHHAAPDFVPGRSLHVATTDLKSGISAMPSVQSRTMPQVKAVLASDAKSDSSARHNVASSNSGTSSPKDHVDVPPAVAEVVAVSGCVVSESSKQVEEQCIPSAPVVAKAFQVEATYAPVGADAPSVSVEASSVSVSRRNLVVIVAAAAFVVLSGFALSRRRLKV